MRKLLLISAFIMMSWGVVANAQDQKRIEHILELGTGLSWNDDDTGRVGGTVSIGYGIDFKLNDRVSVLPMIGYRQTSESAIRSGWDDVDLNDFSFVDLSISGRYQIHTGKRPIVVGVGPYLSLITDRDKYNKESALNGKTKLKKLDFGLMPSISFDMTRHFSLGAKMNIGLLDASEQYSEIHDQESRFLKSTEAFARFRF